MELADFKPLAGVTKMPHLSGKCPHTHRLRLLGRWLVVDYTQAYFGGFGMRLAVFGFVALLACGFSASAEAAVATVQSVKGTVSIDRGSGFQQLKAATAAQPGDRIMAGPASSAKIVYGDGCAVSVAPGSVVSIGKESPCKAPYTLGDTSNWGVVPLILGVTAAAVAYCISGPCRDDDDFRGRASP